MLFLGPPKRASAKFKLSNPALGLVSATYEVGNSITLKFNQPIDISQMSGPEIHVNDVDNNLAYVGRDGPVTRVDAFSVRVDLDVDGPAVGPGTILDASADTRIRAIPGPKTWAGVTELPLPYP
jgi:hypothetical protein